MCGVIYCKYHRGRVVVNCDIYIYIYIYKQTMTTVSANLVIGNVVEITTSQNDVIKGEIFAFEETTGVVILRK